MKVGGGGRYAICTRGGVAGSGGRCKVGAIRIQLVKRDLMQ